tara:strand:+ start:1109 stop:1276 length:168 start_codon:yes stop_codon:yes gene_type:complete
MIQHAICKARCEYPWDRKSASLLLQNAMTITCCYLVIPPRGHQVYARKTALPKSL